MQPGDLVRLRKSHPSVKGWRRTNQRHPLKIGQWAEDGAVLILLRKAHYSDTRWEVIGPRGELASFDYYLLTTRGLK